MEWMFLWIVLCVVSGWIGSSRRIGGITAFFLALFLSPLVGLIVALASERKSVYQFRQHQILQDRKIHFENKKLNKELKRQAYGNTEWKGDLNELSDFSDEEIRKFRYPEY